MQKGTCKHTQTRRWQGPSGGVPRGCGGCICGPQPLRRGGGGGLGSRQASEEGGGGAFHDSVGGGGGVTESASFWTHPNETRSLQTAEGSRGRGVREGGCVKNGGWGAQRAAGVKCFFREDNNGALKSGDRPGTYLPVPVPGPSQLLRAPPVSEMTCMPVCVRRFNRPTFPPPLQTMSSVLGPAGGTALTGRPSPYAQGLPTHHAPVPSASPQSTNTHACALPPQKPAPYIPEETGGGGLRRKQNGPPSGSRVCVHLCVQLCLRYTATPPPPTCAASPGASNSFLRPCFCLHLCLSSSDLKLRHRCEGA